MRHPRFGVEVHRLNPLGPVYIQPLRQRCNNSAMILAILFSLKTIALLKNGLQLHSGVPPLFSMTTVWLASSQSWRWRLAWTDPAFFALTLRFLISSPTILILLNRRNRVVRDFRVYTTSGIYKTYMKKNHQCICRGSSKPGLYITLFAPFLSPF